MMLNFIPANMVLVFDPQGDPRRPWRAACVHDLQSTALWIRIPQGFRCNLASIPSWLLWLAPPNGNHQRAAFFHDAMYALRYTSRATADAIMLEIMTHDQVPYWRRVGMYMAVRLFGHRYWKQDDPAQRAGLVAGRKVVDECDTLC